MYELATGRTVLRSADGATDFIDPKLGPFDLKGPLRANDGSIIEIAEARYSGLAASIVKGVNYSTGSAAVVVDTLGFTRGQMASLRVEVEKKGCFKQDNYIFWSDSCLIRLWILRVGHFGAMI